MKNRILFPLLLLFVLNMVSCSLFYSESERYARNYESFAEDFLSNYSTYEPEDWQMAMQEYENYHNLYSTYATDLSDEHRTMINDYNSKINAVIIKYKTTQTLNGLGVFIDETVGTINELLK